MTPPKKIFRTATVPITIKLLLLNQISFLSKNNFEIYTLSANGIELKDIKQNLGITKHYNVYLKRHISIFYDLIALIQTFFIFVKEKPLIVHSITPKAGLISMAAAYFARVPIRIHTFTGLIFPTKSGFNQKLLIFMDKCICFFATNIYPEGQGVKNDLLLYNITDKQLKVIANGNINGIDLNYFNPNNVEKTQIEKIKNDLNIKQNDFIFLFVGRIVEDKGINELIAAFSEISKSRPSIKLILVGPFEEKNSISIETKFEIDSNQQILSVGYQNDVRPYFSLSNIFVLPSYREGFPNVLLQAGCFGLPSIATNISGCNEIIKEDKNGTLIPPQNKSELKNALLRSIINKHFYFEKNIRKLIENKFDEKYVQNCVLIEYNSLIENYLSKKIKKSV